MGTAFAAGTNLNKQTGDVCLGLVETLFLFLNDSYFSLSDRASSEVRPPRERIFRGLQQGLGSALRLLVGSCGALGTPGQAQLECKEEHPSLRSKEQRLLTAWLNVAHQPGARRVAWLAQSCLL